MSEPGLDEDLVRYLALRDQLRAEEAEQALAVLTERERRLVREAAVMGYVRGVQAGPHRNRIPPDSAIVAEVVAACIALPDLYPLIGSASFEEATDG